MCFIESLIQQYFKFELHTLMDPTVSGPLQMPDIDFQDLQSPPQINNQLLIQLDQNIKSGNWIDSHQCITMIRQINKFHPNFIPDVINRYSNALVDLFAKGKTQITKNLLRLVKQVFDMGQNVNVEKAVYAFLPIIIKKSANDLGHIKEMSQHVLTSFTNNCGYQISFVIAAQFCCDMNVQLAQISIKLLTFLIQKIGQGIMQISPETLQTIMGSLQKLIEGKRQNLKNSSLDICLFIYNAIGSENYLSLMNYSLQPNQVQAMGSAMEMHRVDKKANYVPLANALKARRTQKMQQQYMNQNVNNMNYNNQMYGNSNGNFRC